MRRHGERTSEPAVPLETLNRLAVSIIHEVSNPLSIIIGNAQYILLSRDEAVPKAAAVQDELTSTIQTILDESMRLAGLVSLLLGFSSKITIEDSSPAAAVSELERLLNKLRSSWATGPESGIGDAGGTDAPAKAPPAPAAAKTAAARRPGTKPPTKARARRGPGGRRSR